MKMSKLNMVAALLVSTALAGCDAGPSAGTEEEYRQQLENMSEAEMEEFLIEAAPTPEAAARLKLAFADPEMPSVKTVPIPKQFLDVRQRPRAGDADNVTPKLVPPVLDKRMVAEARLWKVPPIAKYEGAARLIRSDAGNLSLALEGQEDPASLLYVVPDLDMIPALKKKEGTFSLSSLDSKSRYGSLDRRIALTDEQGPVLVHLETGDDKPVSFRLKSADISFRQVVQDDRPHSAEVNFEGQVVRLEIGKTAQIRTDSGVYGLYLKMSYAETEPLPVREGDPYHIMLTIWRQN